MVKGPLLTPPSTIPASARLPAPASMAVPTLGQPLQPSSKAPSICVGPVRSCGSWSTGADVNVAEADRKPPATVIATPAPSGAVVDEDEGTTVALVTGPVSTGRGRVSIAELSAEPPSLFGPTG